MLGLHREIRCRGRAVPHARRGSTASGGPCRRAVPRAGGSAACRRAVPRASAQLDAARGHKGTPRSRSKPEYDGIAGLEVRASRHALSLRDHRRRVS